MGSARSRFTRRRGQTEAAVLAVLSLAFGALLDGLVISPFFHTLTKGTSTAGWDPATVFMFFTALPYAASVAIVAVVVGGILGSLSQK